MFKDIGFALLALHLTKKENTNLSNIDRYMDDYYEYFVK